jgi:hypothetical protein
LPKTDKWVAGWVCVANAEPVVVAVRDRPLSYPPDPTAGRAGVGRLETRVSHPADAICSSRVRRMECYTSSVISIKRILVL